MLIGREKETDTLESAIKDNISHFVAIYGRRRIGKTFLVRNVCGERFSFQHAGVSDGGLKEQLNAFISSMSLYGFTYEKTPGNWIQAFDGLKKLVVNSNEKKKVIFIDELSWMDTPKSGFVTALENFWNAFASARNDVVLIICSSATSWMLSKIIHNKGGLYHRLTKQIYLQPFLLRECEMYVQKRGMVLNRDQILQYYMIFGGVPYYWELLQKGSSVEQNIDRILFASDAELKDEFQYLYASIFKNPAIYIRLVETLSKAKIGLTRDEIIDKAGVSNSGDLTMRLEELENCGFIRSYTAFGMKKKNTIYQLIDSFTLFYYSFLKKAPTDEHFWVNQINTPRVNTWKGLAFERVCLLHINAIKRTLRIDGILTEVHSLYCKTDKDKGILGSQIDLLIVRRDQVINLCEMKYSGSEYALSKRDDEDMRRKMHDLSIKAGKKYAIYPTLVTTYGLIENSYSVGVQSVVTMNDLFDNSDEEY